MNSFHFHVITNGDSERKKSTMECFESLGIPFEFHMFEKHPSNGKLGCFLSHIKLYEYALSNKMEYICIAEDNITQTENDIVKQSKELISFINDKKKWKIIILGGWFVPFTTCSPTVYETLYKTNSIHGTTCYIIHKRLYDNILKIYKKHINEHIDYFIMSESFNKAYIVNPFMFRRNNTIPTTNSYFLNSVVDMYHYINCSSRMTRGWSFFSKYYKFVIYLCILILLILLFIIYIIYIKWYS